MEAICVKSWLIAALVLKSVVTRINIMLNSYVLYIGKCHGDIIRVRIMPLLIRFIEIDHKKVKRKDRHWNIVVKACIGQRMVQNYRGRNGKEYF